MNPLIRPLGIAASLLASVQGLAWSVLALLGILIYVGIWGPEYPDYTTSVSNWIYTLFMTDNEDIIMRGGNMIIFTSIYLGLCLIWMIVSLCTLWVLYRQKLQYVRSTIITWSLCTATVSVLDIVTLSLLASDYNTVLNNYENDTIGEWPYSAVAATGIMMTISARGFILLVANIIFAGLFAFWGIRFQEKKDEEESNREFINGYQQRPYWLSNGNTGASGRPFTNQGFEPESNQRFSYDRNRFSATPPAGNTAGLGRNNNPIQSHPPREQQRGPYIPEPDYSPTSLRKNPKSVLKTRQQY